MPELKELVSLLRRSSNNLNQLTRKVHETRRVYDADLEDISQRQEQLWDGVQKDTGPAFQTLLTGQFAPFAEGGMAFFAAPSSVFSFLPLFPFVLPSRIIVARKEG